MEVHGYLPSGCIDITFDGLRLTVPDDPENRHRQIVAEWEAEGNVIPPTVPSPQLFAPISRRQMLLALLSIGITSQMVEAEIAAIADPFERAAGLIEWQAASTIDRDHVLLTDLAETFALPSSQIDALWLWAAGL